MSFGRWSPIIFMVGVIVGVWISGSGPTTAPASPRNYSASVAPAPPVQQIHPVIVSPVSLESRGLRTVVLDLPVGNVRVLSTSGSIYPEIDRASAIKHLPMPTRRALIASEFADEPSATKWGLPQIADRYGMFDSRTVVAAGIEHFFANPSCWADVPGIGGVSRLPSDLTVKVFDSQAALEEASPLWADRGGKNAYYDRSAAEIGIYLDPHLLGQYYPSTDLSMGVSTRVSEALKTTLRTFLIALYHELTHVLQSESGIPAFDSPFVAEGTAQAVASRFERLALIGQLVDRQESTGVARSASTADVLRGDVLLPADYARIGRIRQWFHPNAGRLLARLATMSPEDFGDPESVQRNYDLSWLAFTVVLSERRPQGDSGAIYSVATSLNAQSHLVQLRRIESRITAFTSTNDPTPGKQSIDMLAETVAHSDKAMLNGRPYDAYCAYIALLKRDPTFVPARSYLGDFFLSVGDRDMYLSYYADAMNQEGVIDRQVMSSRLRLLGHYVEGLWSIGRYQDVASIVDKYSITALDSASLDDLTLRRNEIEEANAIRWEPRGLKRLDAEFELGSAVVAADELLTSPLLKRAMTAPRPADPAWRDFGPSDLLREQEFALVLCCDRIIQSMKTLGISSIPDKAWYILDVRAVDSGPDIGKINQLVGKVRTLQATLGSRARPN